MSNSAQTVSKRTGSAKAHFARAKTSEFDQEDAEFLDHLCTPDKRHPDCFYIHTPVNVAEPLFVRRCGDGWRAGLLSGEWPKDFRNPVDWTVWRQPTAKDAVRTLLSRMIEGAKRELERNESLMHLVETGEFPEDDPEIFPEPQLENLKVKDDDGTLDAETYSTCRCMIEVPENVRRRLFERKSGK